MRKFDIDQLRSAMSPQAKLIGEFLGVVLGVGSFAALWGWIAAQVVREWRAAANQKTPPEPGP